MLRYGLCALSLGDAVSPLSIMESLLPEIFQGLALLDWSIRTFSRIIRRMTLAVNRVTVPVKQARVPESLTQT
jgi:hypothetical protein